MSTNKEPTKNLPATQCRLVESFWSFFPAFQRWAESKTTEKKLTPQRTRILACLADKGPQIMSELRDQLGVTATNITALVDAMEKDQLVVRKPHPTDRRATLIEIPAQAAKGVSKGCSAYRENVGALFSALTETERKELLRLMDLLRARLEQEAAEAATV